MLEQLLALMAETFEVDQAELSAETQFGDVPRWDSMGHMDLMVALESQFGIAITAESIAELVSVSKILEAVEAQGNG